MSNKNKQLLLKEKQALLDKKAKLEKIKAEAPDSWTDKLQVTLDEVDGEITDIEEEIAEAEKQESKVYKDASYKLPKNTERFVHLAIIKGRRFDENTGKEIAVPRVQMFNYGEFKLFLQNGARLGYKVVKVLYDPTGEANKLLNQ